ncbi:MAG: hypothetical protein NVSMB64_32730 [Candidatus Velthaea sp.]
MPSPRHSYTAVSIALAGAVFAGTLLAGCGSSTSTAAALPAGPPAGASTPLPTSAGTLTTPTVAGRSVTFAIAAGAPAGDSITMNAAASAPANAPAPSSVARKPQAIAGAVPFFWVTFTVSLATPTSVFAAESVTLGTLPSTANYYVEFDDVTTPAGTKLGAQGPGSIANGNVTITNGGGGGGGTNTLNPGSTYLAQFYYLPAGSPVPSSTPSAAPSSSPSAAPSSVPSPVPSASSSPNIATYTFGGPPASVAVSPGQTPSPISNPSYNGVSASISFDSSASTAATLKSALSKSDASDITPAGFATLTSAGTIVTYFELSANVSVTFNNTPAFSISTAASLPAGTCSFWAYTQQGSSGFNWHTIESGTKSGTTVNFAALPAAQVGGQVSFGPTPFYGAIACQ